MPMPSGPTAFCLPLRLKQYGNEAHSGFDNVALVGEFGRDAIHVSTAAISSHDPGEYASLEAQLQALVTRRNALASDIEAQLDKIPGCSGFTANTQALDHLNDRGQELLEDMRHLAAGHGDEDDNRFDDGD